MTATHKPQAPRASESDCGYEPELESGMPLDKGYDSLGDSGPFEDADSESGQSLAQAVAASQSSGSDAALAAGGESAMASAGVMFGQFASIGLGVVSAISAFERLVAQGPARAHISVALGLVGFAAVCWAGVNLVALLKHLGTKELRLTTQRVVALHYDGRLLRYAIPLEELARVEVTRSMFGRLFGYGTLVFRSRTKQTMSLRRIADPDRFLRVMAIQPQFSHVVLSRDDARGVRG